MSDATFDPATGRRSWAACVHCGSPGQDLLGTPIWHSICRATRMLVAGHSVEQVVESLDLSSQSLDRLFRWHLGISPSRLKTFLDQSLSAPDRDSLVVQRRSTIEVEVPFAPPLDLRALWVMLGELAADGVEVVDERGYRRLFRLADTTGSVVISEGKSGDHLSVAVTMSDWSSFAHVMLRVRQLMNLDADGSGAVQMLSRDDIIGHLVRDRPGVRPPGCWDSFEAAVKATLGSGWDIRGKEWLRRLVERSGEPAHQESEPRLTQLFPVPARVAGLRAGELGLPFVKAVAVHGIAYAVCGGSGITDSRWCTQERVQELAILPGVGPVAGARYAWILGDPDSYPEKAGAASSETEAKYQRRAGYVADRWRPYRSFAYAHLAVAASLPHLELLEPENGWSRARHHSDEPREAEPSTC